MKTLKGFITNIIDHRTAKVKVERRWKHPLYKKYITRSKNFLVDYDKDMKLEEGMKVVIQEVRPISKLKHFKIVKIIES